VLTIIDLGWKLQILVTNLFFI